MSFPDPKVPPLRIFREARRRLRLSTGQKTDVVAYGDPDALDALQDALAARKAALDEWTEWAETSAREIRDFLITLRDNMRELK